MGAGTDANVFLILYGDKGQSGKMKMKNSITNKNKFEKGKKDVFKVATSNIGEIVKINISHDGAGPGAGWFLESIIVNNLTTKKITKYSNFFYLFDCIYFHANSKIKFKVSYFSLVGFRGR